MIYFFFQAEDGIRDLTVTGVKTCALPIWTGGARTAASPERPVRRRRLGVKSDGLTVRRATISDLDVEIGRASCREECRSRGRPHHYKEKNEGTELVVRYDLQHQTTDVVGE